MPELTTSQLLAIMPACPDTESWTPALNAAMEQFDITTAERIAGFLAQLAHESGQMKRMTENLNYSAQRLMQVWPARFPTLGKAQQFERNPEKLAN